MREKIYNRATGDSIEFLETAEESQGAMSHFIMTLAPHNAWAKSPRHFHPYQTETFKVLEGELHLTAGDHKYVLKPGDDKIVVTPFMLHSFWNATDEPVRFEAEIYPPRKIEKGIRTTYALSQEGKVTKRNIPRNVFVTLILMEEFDSYLSFLPWKFQRILFRLGAGLARLMGYRT